jgi:hypothetical protein
MFDNIGEASYFMVQALRALPLQVRKQVQFGLRRCELDTHWDAIQA